MLQHVPTAQAKRVALRAMVESGELHVLPGVFNALSAQLVEAGGFAGAYLSGYGVAADAGLPDLGLTTSVEVARKAQEINRVVGIPLLADADTGFGEPLNMMRTMQLFEEAGIAGCHIEDQVNPKQCGHLHGVRVVDLEVAVRRLRAALSARRDPNFIIVGRTDARKVMGLAEALDRATAYEAEGADVVFVEALASLAEIEEARRRLTVPILVNLNEHDGALPWTQQQLRDVGVNIAIYPVTLLRVAMGAVSRAIDALVADGHQHGLIDQMHTQSQFHALIDYDAYRAADSAIAGPGSPGDTTS